MVNVLLCMIVKNEERILERCIESVKNIVDGISICDTGSSDNTVEVIEKWSKILGGECHHHQWKNFGHNRTQSFLSCIQTAKKMKLNLDQTYALLLDADMVLQIKDTFNKNQLGTDSGYKIAQTHGGLFYYNMRLVKLSQPWKCVGVTHEYWDGPSNQGTITSLVIDDRNDGGSKSDKYERDIRLLTQGIKDEPHMERYLYYLGQSYKDSGKFDEAISCFTKRIDRGGWIEEVWYSYLQIARCYRSLHNETEMTNWFLKAYEYHPKRAESLCELANYYRLHGKNNLAFMFARQASEIPFPENDILFIDKNTYDYNCELEKSISAFYTTFYKEEGYKSCNKIILNKSIPENIKNMTKPNMLFYLPTLSKNIIDININLPEKYVSCNPFLTIHKGKLVGCIRTVNFLQNKGEYKVQDGTEKVNTKNFFVEFDSENNIIKQSEIIDKVERIKWDHRVWGLEDMRLFNYQEEWWFTATSCQEQENYRNPIQCLGKMIFNEENNTYDIIDIKKCSGDFLQETEKNWLPFVYDNKPLIIYKSEPFTMIEPNLYDKSCNIISKKSCSQDASNFRGSSSPIPYKDGYIYVEHEVAFINWRTYYHRVVKFNKNFEIIEISKPFIFENRGVEFCISLVHQENKFIFGVGIEDKRAIMVTITEQEMENLFLQ